MPTAFVARAEGLSYLISLQTAVFIYACRQEQIALKDIVRNLQAGDAAVVLLDFHMKAQESLTNIERGLNAMREEINTKLGVINTQLEALLGHDVLKYIAVQVRRFLDGFSRLRQEVYVESKLLEEGTLKDFKEDATNTANPAITTLRKLWVDKLELKSLSDEELKSRGIDAALLTGAAGMCTCCFVYSLKVIAQVVAKAHSRRFSDASLL